jgi:uncharacterized membrane protein YdjX (TVP38/TMEM64 family)
MTSLDQTSEPNWTRRRLLLVIALVLGLGALIWVGSQWGMRATLESAIQGLRAAGPWVFFGAMAFLPLFGVPLMPFTLAAGPAFGPVLGAGQVILLAIAAVGVNVALAYGMASRALRPLFISLAGFFGYQLPTAPSTWHLAAMIRLAPGLPFFVQSYVLGLLQVPFVSYLVISILVPAGYISGVVLLGDAMWRGEGRTVFFALSLLVLAGTALHFLRRRRFPTAGPLSAGTNPAAPATRAGP